MLSLTVFYKVDNFKISKKSHDLNELIYAVCVGDQGPIYVSLSNGIAMLSRGDLSQKLKFVENFGTPFTHLTTGKKFSKYFKNFSETYF